MRIHANKIFLFFGFGLIRSNHSYKFVFTMQIGLLGLGKMGRLILDKLLADGHEVVVWNRSKEVMDQMNVDKSQFILTQKLRLTHTFDQFHETLLKPSIIWTMLPAGDPTNTILEQIQEYVGKGDVVIDGGNSNFKDSEKWAKEFANKEVKFLGIGVSGGVHARENGCCLMVGGDADAYEYCRAILDSLAKPNGLHTYFGPGGAGHYVKMVHNGIEYGIMQSLGEGLGVLARSEYRLNLLQVAHTWQKGSIIESFLLNMAVDALSKDPTLSQTEGIIDATGEAKWTVEEAQANKIPIGAIEKSLQFRLESQYDTAIQQTFAAKLVQALRKEFGGHPDKKIEAPQPQ